MSKDAVEEESRSLGAVVLHDRVERVEPVEGLLVVDVGVRFALRSDAGISFDLGARGERLIPLSSGTKHRLQDSGLEARRTLSARVLLGTPSNGQVTLS
jgi:hypothetical protein